MPQGIIVRDAANNIIMDNTTRCGRVLGFVATGTSDGSISPPDASQGALFGILVNSSALTSLIYTPTISITSTTIYWSWGSIDPGNRMSFSLMYGVY